MAFAVNPYTHVTRPVGVTSPPTAARAVTPDDSNDLAIVCRGLYIGVTGDVEATLVDDSVGGGANSESPQVYRGLPAGYILVGFFSRVLAASTTADGILALY